MLSLPPFTRLVIELATCGRELSGDSGRDGLVHAHARLSQVGGFHLLADPVATIHRFGQDQISLQIHV